MDNREIIELENKSQRFTFQCSKCLQTFKSGKYGNSPGARYAKAYLVNEFNSHICKPKN
jgi:hypothetical protein